MKWRFATPAAAVTLVAASYSMALPSAGTQLIDFTVHDTSDVAHAISSLRADKVTLLVFEDRDGGKQNQRFKEKFGALVKKPRVADKAILLPIADVSNWNFFPARGFVKDALAAASRKSGLMVYADWTGKGRVALTAQQGTSTLVLVDKTGMVRWASGGQLTEAQEESLLALTEAVVAAK